MPEAAYTIWACVAGIATVATILAVARTLKHDGRSVRLDHPPDHTWVNLPSPGEIWWARVGFRDRSGHKDRPCLIIRTHAHYVVALPMTSRDRSGDSRYQEVYRTRDWDLRAKGNSFVNLREHVIITPGGLLRCAGMCSRRTWAVVRSQHRTGWVIESARRRRWSL